MFVDSGVPEPGDAALLSRVHDPGAEPIVESRALTVALLDRLAGRVREALGPGAAALSLGRVLQGGTCQAGRELAREHRPDSGPPIRGASDGTLF